jgi:class 3 adenylate cyclase/tetratricopeptide (TPR) repeat protein
MVGAVTEPGDFLGAEPPSTGELRRLTIMFCDLVGSTALAARHEPELYRRILRRYKDTCRRIIVDRYEGYIATLVGDGLLAVFGHPSAHEDDARRAVRAGLDIVGAVRRLSEQTEREVGDQLAARVAVHKGLVYLDTEENDIYGLAANVAARLQDLAPPDTVVISSEMLRLVDDWFETEEQPTRTVKGVDEPLASWVVVGQRRVRAGARHRWVTPLVGRDAELGHLHDAWLARPGAVLLRGEPGLGKSRLLGAIAGKVGEGDGAEVVQIDGSPFHTEAGFHPLRMLAEERCGIGRDTDGPQRLRLLYEHLESCRLDADELVPFLGPVLGIAPEAGYVAAPSDAAKLHDQITEAMRDYLSAVLGSGPTLLLVDDLQWFDASTRDLLTTMVRDQPDDLLVVMTARKDTPPPLPAIEVIDLEPLPEHEGVRLAAALDPDGAVSHRLAELVARSDGVPLYLEELVRAALHTPPTSAVEQVEPTTAVAPPPSEMSVPEVLYEPLLARLSATGSDARVLAAAATIGRSVERRLLADVVGIEAPELDGALNALVEGLIIEREDGTSEQFRFRHELLREVAYELQPPSARRANHGRVADALARSVPEGGVTDWLVLAKHYEYAERLEEALDCYDWAAEEARRRGALGEARGLLGRAIDLVRQSADDPRRASRESDLLLRRGFLAVSSEGNASPEAVHDYERCLELATDEQSPDKMVKALITLWGYYASRADLASAYRVSELMRAMLTEGRERLRPENEAGFGMLDWFSGRFRSAQERLEQAAEDARQRGRDERAGAVWFLPNDPLSSIHTHLALARFMRGDPVGAADAIAQAEQMAAELPFPQGPFSTAYNSVYGSWIDLELGHLDRAAVSIGDTLTLAERHGFSFWTIAATVQQALLDAVRHRLHDPCDRAALAQQAGVLAGLVVTWQMIDTRVFLPPVITGLGLALVAAGDLEGGCQRFDEASTLADETGVRFYAAETLRARALAGTDRTQVEDGLRRALELAQQQGAVAFELRVARDLLRVCGRAARPLLSAAVDQFAADASYPELDESRSLLTEIA